MSEAVDLSKAWQSYAAEPGVAFGIPGPEFQLPNQIRDYISLRDKYWQELIAVDFASESRLERLRICNDAVREMLTLTPGPTTPVLPADEVRFEKLRVAICAVFITRCRMEIAAEKRLSPRAVLALVMPMDDP